MHLPQKKIIELSDVSVAYDSRIALQDVNFAVDEGDFVAVTGPNGGGKTTLLKVILQLVKPTRGKVTFRSRGEVVKQLKIGYLPQKNMIDSRFPITVEDVVLSGLLGDRSLMRRFSCEETERADAMLRLVGMDDRRRSPIGALSGGQLQRTLLGRALIANPEVVVLDEPLSYIDKHFEAHLYDIIADYARHSTIILVSHEMTTISQMASRHIIVDKTLHDCKAAHHYVRSECE